MGLLSGNRWVLRVWVWMCIWSIYSVALYECCDGRRAIRRHRLLSSMLDNDHHGRELLQAVSDEGSDSQYTPSYDGVGDVSSNVTSNLPIDVDSTVQLCMPSFNTYFFPFANGNRQVVDPVKNLKASSRECCASCLETKRCNAWQWCPVEAGCSFSNTTGKSLSNTSFPYLGCQLLDLEGFSEYLFDLTDVKSRGEAIPFIAGAPINITVTSVPGYQAFPGNELGRTYDFECDLDGLALLNGASQDGSVNSIISIQTIPIIQPLDGNNASFWGGDGVDVLVGDNSTRVLYYNSSSEFGCVVLGSPTMVADVCSATNGCDAFNYYDNGIDPSPLRDFTTALNMPMGVLKGGNLKDAFVTSLELNPNSIVYVKDGIVPESAASIGEAALVDANAATDTSGGGTSTVVIVVVSVVVGLVVIAGFIAMVVYVRRYQQMTKSFPSPPNSSNTPRSQIRFSGNANMHDALPMPYNMQKKRSSDEDTGSIPESDTPTTGRLTMHNQMNNGFLVSEVSLPSDVTSAEGPQASRGSAPGSMRNGSSARDLMDAFSQMYKQRPVVDYMQLGSLLEDEESKAAAELEAAVEESRKSSASGTPRAQSSKIPSAIAKESSGLADTGLVDDWSILPEEVEVCRRPDGTWWQLGTGGFGTVYKGLYHGIHPVAIKIIHHVEEERHKDSFIREASLLKALRHKNVVQFLGASLDGPHGTALLVTELMELGDLWRALSAKDASGERIFSWYNRGAQCMVDVAKGLHYLHTKRVVHFDLKSANILLSRAGTAKLADIGMARVLNKSYLSVISGLGTFAWSAPEVLAGKRCTEKADIFSWGVVLWEICTGEAPARGDMRPLQAPEDCPQVIVDLYQSCVAENPEDRPSAKEVLNVLSTVCKIS